MDEQDRDSTARFEARLRDMFRADRQLPADLGPYRLLERIGAGGMGVVYRAEQQFGRARREVALKLIHPDRVTADSRRRFEFEAQALAAMAHDAIARIYDTGFTADGQPFLAMELVVGVPITQYCNAHRLDVPARVRLFQRVCEAVDHAHRRLVLHRDLKPGNVLVADRDGVPAPKVIDFGIARALDREARGLTELTEQGMAGGTREFMAPEQAAGGPAAADTRADVYSLGAMLYELMTGELPFDSARLRHLSWSQFEQVLRDEEPPRPSVRIATAADPTTTAASRRTSVRGLAQVLAKELDWIVARAMAKDPARRYASAAEFAQDLGRYLAGDPVLAGPPTLGYRLRRVVRRHARQLVVAATLLVAAMAVVWSQVTASRQAAAADRLQAQVSARDLAVALAVVNRRSFVPQQALGERLRNDHARKLRAYVAALRAHGLDLTDAASRARFARTVVDAERTPAAAREQVVDAVYQMALTAFASEHAFAAEQRSGGLCWQPPSFDPATAPTDPGELEVWFGLLDVLPKIDPLPARRDIWQRVVAAIRTGQSWLQPYFVRLPRTERAAPENLLVVRFLANWYGAIPPILEAWRDITHLTPDLVEPRVELCHESFLSPDPQARQEAMAHAHAARALDPQHFWVLAMLSHLYRQLGHWQDAVFYAGRAVALEPEEAFGWEALAYAWDANADPKVRAGAIPLPPVAGSLAAFARALELGSTRVVDASRALQRLFGPDVALQFLERKVGAPEYRDVRPAIWTEQASLLGNCLGDSEHAYAVLLRGVQTDPNWSLAWFQLGDNLRLKGYPEQAIPCLQRALDTGGRDWSYAGEVTTSLAALRSLLPHLLSMSPTPPTPGEQLALFDVLRRRNELVRAAEVFEALVAAVGPSASTPAELLSWSQWADGAALAAAAAEGLGSTHQDRTLVERFPGAPCIEEEPYGLLPRIRHDRRSCAVDDPAFATRRSHWQDRADTWLRAAVAGWEQYLARTDLTPAQRAEGEAFAGETAKDVLLGPYWARIQQTRGR